MGIDINVIVGKERRDMGRSLKTRGHLRLVGTRAYQTTIGARAKGKAKRIQQNRFTGPGLTREHTKTACEFQVQCLDQHDIADRKPR